MSRSFLVFLVDINLVKENLEQIITRAFAVDRYGQRSHRALRTILSSRAWPMMNGGLAMSTLMTMRLIC